MPKLDERRDKEVIRKIHRLFWRGSCADLPALIVWLCTKPVAAVLYNIAIPFQIAYVLQAIIDRNFSSIPQYAYNILGFAVGYCVLGWFGAIAISRNNRAGINYVQREVLANFLAKDYEYYTNAHVGTLSSQASQMKIAFNNYTATLNESLADQAVIIMTGVAIIACQSLALAIGTVLIILVLLAVTVLSMKWQWKHRQELVSSHDEVNGELGDILDHATTVKSFAAESYEKSRLDKSFSTLASTQYRSWLAFLLPDQGRQLLAAIAILVVLILTAHLYEDNSISIAVVLLIQLYMIKIIAASSQISAVLKHYDDFMTTACSAAKTMLITPNVVDKKRTRALAKGRPKDVALHDVSYRYAGSGPNTFAVKNFTLHIAQGERIGLVGYSGSGKSTLTKLMLRFMDVTSGKITISGVDIREAAQEELRQHIAYVPQEPLLFHRSVAENIAYGKPTATDEAIHRAGHAAYVDEFLADLPKGYDTLVGEKGVRLSGGQRQRIAIARAILKDAPILVLDEATSALDSHSEQYIQKALAELMKDRTTLVIAHRLSTIQRMDRIVVMDKGRIVAIGTHQELLSHSNGIYAQLWAHQSSMADSLIDAGELSSRILVDDAIG